MEDMCQNRFTNWIANACLRDTWKIKFPKFLRRLDPKAHICALRLAVVRAHLSSEEKEVGYYIFFVKNLAGPALKWFDGLEGNSIGKFTQLPTAFLKHYFVYKEEKVSERAIFL